MCWKLNSQCSSVVRQWGHEGLCPPDYYYPVHDWLSWVDSYKTEFTLLLLSCSCPVLQFHLPPWYDTAWQPLPDAGTIFSVALQASQTMNQVSLFSLDIPSLVYFVIAKDMHLKHSREAFLREMTAQLRWYGSVSGSANSWCVVAEVESERRQEAGRLERHGRVTEWNRWVFFFFQMMLTTAAL